MNPFDKYYQRKYPYSDEYYEAEGEPGSVDLELLSECLEYARSSGEPLPEEILVEMLWEVNLLRRGFNSELFKKAHTQLQHPRLAQLERAAVSYVAIHRISKSDRTPIKTIQTAFKVSRPTVYDWEKKYDPIIPNGPLKPGEIDPGDPIGIVLLGELYCLYKERAISLTNPP